MAVDPPRVAPDMLVSVAFQLYDAAGDLVDEVPAAEPLTYVHGYAQVIPGLEAGLVGALEAEERSIVVLPEDAFGAHDPDARLEIDPADFPESEDAVVGGEIVARGPDGVEAVHRIIEVDEDAIVVDLNHPLAGEMVRFEARVGAVRPATDAELDAAQADISEMIAMSNAASDREAVAHGGTVVYGSQSGDPAMGAPDGSLVQLRIPVMVAGALRGPAVSPAGLQTPSEDNDD